MEDPASLIEMDKLARIFLLLVFFFGGKAPEVEKLETRKTGMKVLKTGEYNCRGEEHHHLSSMGTE